MKIKNLPVLLLTIGLSPVRLQAMENTGKVQAVSVQPSSGHTVIVHTGNAKSVLRSHLATPISPTALSAIVEADERTLDTKHSIGGKHESKNEVSRALPTAPAIASGNDTEVITCAQDVPQKESFLSNAELLQLSVQLHNPYFNERYLTHYLIKHVVNRKLQELKEDACAAYKWDMNMLADVVHNNDKSSELGKHLAAGKNSPCYSRDVTLQSTREDILTVIMNKHVAYLILLPNDRKFRDFVCPLLYNLFVKWVIVLQRFINGELINTPEQFFELLMTDTDSLKDIIEIVISDFSIEDLRYFEQRLFNYCSACASMI